MKLEEGYQVLKEEVAIFRDSIRDLLEANQTAKEKYKGCCILMSHLVERPPILFLGINPGPGLWKSSQKVYHENELEPLDRLEYLTEEFRLAKETLKLFEIAGYTEILEKCMKSNVYYFATESESKMYDLLNSLGQEIQDKCNGLSAKWTKQLISMVKPKLIICEGYSAFKNICHIYFLTPVYEENFGYCKMADDTLVIGYKRLFSNIIDKQSVAIYLKKQLAGLF